MNLVMNGVKANFKKKNYNLCVRESDTCVSHAGKKNLMLFLDLF